MFATQAVRTVWISHGVFDGLHVVRAKWSAEAKGGCRFAAGSTLVRSTDSSGHNVLMVWAPGLRLSLLYTKDTWP